MRILSEVAGEYNPQNLVASIVEGIQEKKGTNIAILDLSEVESAICHYFVICDGTSTTHVEAVADSVEETVRKLTSEKPFHTDGYSTAQWIILDYVDVMVHVFHKPVREYYALEDLWDDAKKTNIDNLF